MTAFLALALAAAGPTLHLKVDGPGFVRLLQDGSTVYMNDLTATVHEGRLVGPGRRPILPEVQVGSAAGLSIQSDGWVMADGRRAGRIMVALLSSRREISAGVWTTPDRPTVGWPGDDRFGRFSIGSTASAPAPLPSPTPSSPTGGLTLPALLEVSGDQIGLHAALGLPIPADGDPSLGTTPPFGVTRRLSLRTIQATAQRSGLNRTISGPDWVEVRRQGQVLSIDRLVESARSVMQGFPAASLLPGQTDLTVPTGTLQLRAGEPAVTPSRITVSVEIVVDGRRWNARQVVFENRAPWTQIRAGQSIKILVVSNGASVEVPGKVRRVDQRTGEITVESSTKAILTGWLNAAGQVEVKA